MRGIDMDIKTCPMCGYVMVNGKCSFCEYPPTHDELSAAVRHILRYDLGPWATPDWARRG